MPRGTLAAVLRDVLSWGAPIDGAPYDVAPVIGRPARRHLSFDTAFVSLRPDALQQPPAAGAVNPEMQPPNAAHPSGKPAPTIAWENTEGLPDVTINQQAAEYFSEDIGNLPGQSVFNPTFGCKCGDWRPAPTHPSITFRPEFLASHPDFLANVAKLKVHLEDTTANKVHWDAEYDIARFRAVRAAGSTAAPNFQKGLAETVPAIPSSGQALRFMTFCPPEGGPPHSYELTVTALDQFNDPIEYFSDAKTSLSVSPPPPEPPPPLPGTPPPGAPVQGAAATGPPGGVAPPGGLSQAGGANAVRAAVA